MSELRVSFWEGLARKVNALHLKPAGTTLSSVAGCDYPARPWSRALLTDSVPSKHLLDSSRMRQRLVGSGGLLSFNFIFSQARFYLRGMASEPGPARISNVSW